MLVATNVHSSDNDRLTREQQAAKTEVWEPVPNVVSFSANNVPSDATLLLGKDLSGWESLEGGDAA
ncbi:MAG: hypothetical protein VX078_14565, partial [Pseudomonadota bacterium]|nr:hypothetical protein [Pseudomonadota bacterium]